MKNNLEAYERLRNMFEVCIKDDNLYYQMRFIGYIKKWDDTQYMVIYDDELLKRKKYQFISEFIRWHFFSIPLSCYYEFLLIDRWYEYVTKAKTERQKIKYLNKMSIEYDFYSVGKTLYGEKENEKLKQINSFLITSFKNTKHFDKIKELVIELKNERHGTKTNQTNS